MQVRTRDELEELGNALLEPLFPVAKGIRLLGISLSSLGAEEAGRLSPLTWMSFGAGKSGGAGPVANARAGAG